MLGAVNAVDIAILLFLLSLRRAGKRAGRMAEHLELWRREMQFIVGCWTPRLVGLMVAERARRLRGGQF